MIRNSDLFDCYVVHDQMVHVELSLRRVWSLMGGNSVLLSRDDIDAACALQSQIQISSLFLSHKRWLVSTFFFCYTGRTLEEVIYYSFVIVIVLLHIYFQEPYILLL